MPSSVVISRPATPCAGITQARAATPSTCTVQAPHWPRPQPNLGPLSPRSLRSTCSSEASCDAVMSTLRPLTFSASPGIFLVGSDDVRGLDALHALGRHLLPGRGQRAVEVDGAR